MDRLTVSLLNTGLAKPDPLETPLGAALWWASIRDAAAGLPLQAGLKPRFDPVLAGELRAFRNALAEMLAGGEPLAVRFTGTPADGVLFPIAHAAAVLLAGERRHRVKRCVRPECRAYYLDESKNASRRWCSLRCMERARAPRRRTIAR